MADTPDERLLAMTDVVAHALSLLAQILDRLPVPIKLPSIEAGTSHKDFFDGLNRVRTLIEDEPIPGDAIGHLDQAVLMILTGMDLVHMAATHKIQWRYDAVHLHCATAAANLYLSRMILDGELSEE